MKLSKSKRIISAVSAAAFALSASAFTASAEETEQLPEGVYARAGIVWMIMDQWDHRNTLDTEPLDEFEQNVISCTHHDVYITGNGQYEVDMSGYIPPADYIDYVLVGNFGVEFTLDLVDNPEMEHITITLDECTFDGVTYTFNTQPEYEESPLGTIMKIKNPYGVHADTTPEMDDSPWRTTDPITVKFTISGLETDKIEDYPDEKIEKVFGNGSVENDPVEEEEPAEESAAEEPAAESEAEASKSEEKTEEKADEKADDKKDEEESSKLPIFIGIGAGVVVIAVAAIIVAKKKK